MTSSRDYPPRGSERGGPAARSQAAPHLARQLDAERELRPLIPDGHVVALDGRGETALRADAELVERDVPGRLVEAPLEVVLLLEGAHLRRHQAQATRAGLGGGAGGGKN